MRLSKYRPTNDTSLELSTTSMIDVVFLLLIFFLVTTTFLTPERQIKPNIKIEEQASTTSSNKIEPPVVNIVRENGIAVYRFGMTVTSNLEIISALLEQYPDKSSGALVRLSDDCPFGMAAAAVSRCRRFGFDPVSMVPHP